MKRPLLKRKIEVATAKETARKQYLLPKRRYDAENEEFMAEAATIKPHSTQQDAKFFSSYDTTESAYDVVDLRPELQDVLDVTDAKRMCQAFGLLE